MPIFSYIFNVADKLPLQYAIKTSGEKITYSELIFRVRQMAGLLHARGFKSHDRVMIFLPNCAEFIIGFFAIVYAGGTAVLADIKYKREIIDIINENNISLVITDSSGQEAITKTIKDIDNPLKSIQFIDRDDFKLYKSLPINDTFINFSCPNIEDKDEALILYTSGSTGKPRGVINTHETLQGALENYIQTFKIAHNDKLLAVTPFFHSYAFGSCMLAGLASGATLLVMESFIPRQVLNLIKNEKATIFHGVPYMYNLFLKYDNTDPTCFDSIRMCISAGAPLMEDIARAFYKQTCKIIHQEYGSSETGTIALNLNDDIDMNIKSVGKPLNHVEVKIEKEQNEEIGIIQIKSPGMSIGYVGSKPFKKGWYETGDLGVKNSDGYIFISGRKKNVINIAGTKVNPIEVEQVLLKHPGVADACVWGVYHADLGEIIEALVVKQDCDLQKIDLLSHCQKYLSLVKLPRRINWVDQIEKTGLGKVKHEL